MAKAGLLVGAVLYGKKVVLVDDVISSGKAIRESATIVQEAGARLQRVSKLDRQESGQTQQSTRVELEDFKGVPLSESLR